MATALAWLLDTTYGLRRWYGLAISCITFASVIAICRSVNGGSFGKLLDQAAEYYVSVLAIILSPLSAIVGLTDIDRLFMSIGLIFYAVFARTIFVLKNGDNARYKDVAAIVIWSSVVAIPFPYYGAHVIENGVIRELYWHEYVGLLPFVGALYAVICLAAYVAAPILGKWNNFLLREITERLRVVFWLAVNATTAIAAVAIATILSV